MSEKDCNNSNHSARAVLTAFVRVEGAIVVFCCLAYIIIAFWCVHLLSLPTADMSTAATTGGILVGFVTFAQSALGKFFDVLVKLLNLPADSSSTTTTTTTTPPAPEAEPQPTPGTPPAP